MQTRTLSLDEWQQEAIDRFGEDSNRWSFMCPSCGQDQTREDFANLGENPRRVDQVLGFSCIGMWLYKRHFDKVVDYAEYTKGYGCTYSGRGFPNISPVSVVLPNGQARPTFEWSNE